MRLSILVLLVAICSIKSLAQDCDLSLSSGYPNIVSPRCGESNGSIEILATGSGQVLYSLNGSPFTPNGLFSNLDPGAYEVDIKDDDCMITFSTILENQSEIVVNSITSLDSECSEPTGSISIDAEGVNLQYQLDNGPLQSSGQFSGLDGGNYRIRIIDAIGCEFTEMILIRNGDIAISGISSQNSRCAANEGQIVVNASSSTPLEYRLRNVTDWQPSNVFEQLDIGNYTIDIKDQTGCIITRTRRIRQILNYNIFVEGSLCDGNTGSIDIEMLTVGNYEFSLNGGDYQDSSSWTNLPIGTYTIDIRNIDGGCVRRITAVIGTSPAISEIEAVTTDANCYQNNGQILVTANGENLRYLLFQDSNLIDENNSGLFQYLPIGSYVVRIYEGETDCFIPIGLDINEINDIVVESIETIPSNCIDATGEATIHATANDEALTFSVDGGIFQASNYFENLSPGEHTLEINSTSGCRRTEMFFIQEINDISITQIITRSPTDACTSDGILEIYALGTDVEYSLDGINYQESSIFENLSQGIYIAYVRNSLGCDKQSGDIELLTPFTIANIDIQETTCGDSNGSITVVATGADLEYSLDNENFSTTFTFENLESGNHTAYVKSGNCIIQEEFIIANVGSILIDDVIATQTTCGNADAIVQIISKVDEPLTYSLDGINFQESPSFSGIAGGTTVAYVRGEDSGCIGTFEFEVPESHPINYELELTPTICADKNGQIKINPSGGVGPIEFSIDNGPFQSMNTFDGLEKGEYLITIRDSVGCQVSQIVELDRSCLELFPTAFVPNNNGKNERFRLLYFEDVDILSYRIYNRWGNLMYEQNNFNTREDDKFWDGANEMPDQYLAHVVYIMDGETKEYSGGFQLIR